LSFASTTVATSATIITSAPIVNATPQIITVHVAGSVKNPGVYRLKYGSRINDGIVAAGGATSAANLDVINLATVLNEGEQIYVPKRGEKPHTITNRPQLGGGGDAAGGLNGVGGATSSAVPQLININLASVVELEQLPGVGPATAKAIVAYREKNGAFLKVEDLLKVRGIGPAKLSEILPRARVN
jgi:competence protein ComEA